MSRQVHFSIQCNLINGKRMLVSWIPESYAIKGKRLKLKNRNTGQWEDGWVVMDTGAKQPYEFVIERSQDYKKMREVTDI